VSTAIADWLVDHHSFSKGKYSQLAMYYVPTIELVLLL